MQFHIQKEIKQNGSLSKLLFGRKTRKRKPPVILLFTNLKIVNFNKLGSDKY